MYPYVTEILTNPKRVLLRQKSAITEVILLMGGDFGGKLVSFIVAVYLARVLGPTYFGYLALGQTIANYFALLIDGGLGKYETRLVAQEIGETDRDIERIGTVLAGRLLLSVVAVGVYSLIVLQIQSDVILNGVLLLSATWVFASVLNMDWYWQGRKRTGMVGLARFLGPSILLITCVLVVRLQNSINVAVLARSGAYLSVNLFLLHFAFRHLGAKRTINLLRRLNYHERVPRALGASFPLLLSAALISLYSSNLDLVALKILRSAEEVGTYAAVYRLYQPLASVTVVLVYFWYPRLSQSSVAQTDRARQVRQQFAVSTLFLVVPISVGMMLFGPDVFITFFGEEYASGGGVLRILSVAPILAIVGAYFVTILTAYGFFHDLIWCYASGAITIIVGNIVLVPMFGMIGSAVATVSAEAMVLLVGRFFASKRGIATLATWTRDVSLLYLPSAAMILTGVLGHLLFEGRIEALLFIFALGLFLYTAMVFTFWSRNVDKHTRDEAMPGSSL